MKGGAMKSGALKSGALKSGGVKAGYRAVSGQFSLGKPHLGGRRLPPWPRSANWAPGPRGGARAAPAAFQRAPGAPRGAVAAAAAQLAASSRRGSRILVVDGFPNGYGALTGRPDRAAERRRPGGFSGVSAGGRGARVEAAIAQGTGVLSLPRAVGGGNCGCNRPRARCRPSAAPPGGGAHRPACDGAVSARCWLGKPHLGGE